MVPTAEPGEVSSCPAGCVSAFCRHLALRELGQPEVQNLQLPALRQKQIRRLDVPVHDALGMGRFQRIGHLDCQRQHRFRVHRPPRHLRREGLPFQQLHHDEILQLVTLNGVDRADIRVIQ